MPVAAAVDTMQLVVGVKRKYDEMEDDGGVMDDVTGDATGVATPSYPAQRQSILNMSMCKLRTPAQGRREPSLRRSVLIFNTLRCIETELRREGCAFLPPPAPIVFPPTAPAEQDMTLDPPPPAGEDDGRSYDVAMDTTSCGSDGWCYKPAPPFCKAPCTTSSLVGGSTSACGTCSMHSNDVMLTTCSSDVTHRDVMTPNVTLPLTTTSTSSLPSISTLSSTCPLPPVNTFMEPTCSAALPPLTSLPPLMTSSCAVASSASPLNLSSISDVLLNSVPVLNSTPVATPSKDGPLSPPSSSDATARAQLFDLDAKVPTASASLHSTSPILPAPSRVPPINATNGMPRHAHGVASYSSLISGAFTATAAISMSHVTGFTTPSVSLSCHGGANASSLTTPSFGDVDMSLYDFDLLTSAAPNVKVAPLTAEELLHSFPADSYSGSIGPSPCYKSDFLGDDLDHIMQILVGI